jgi:hypothetical protein
VTRLVAVCKSCNHIEETADIRTPAISDIVAKKSPMVKGEKFVLPFEVVPSRVGA